MKNWLGNWLRHSAYALTSSLLFLFGCGERKGDEASAVKMETKKAETNLCDVAFAIVNGRPITAQFVKDSVLISAKIRELAKRKPTPAFGKWSNREAMRIASGLTYAVAIEIDLESRGIAATAESDAETLARYNLMMRRSAKSVDELAPLFGELEPVFRRQFARDSRIDALYRQTPELEVKEKDISRYFVNLSNRVERCRKINEGAWKKINRAWDELQKGGKWENVATNYSEDAILEKTYADNWKDWMSIDVAKLEPPELAAAVRGLTVGGYTKPMETEEGLVIARVNEREGDFCGLSRILVRSAEEVEIPDRETAIKQIGAELKRDFQQEYISELKERMKFEYPLGTKFYYRIWPEEEAKRK